ncbi:uncharacterized protein LOC144376422 [Ictidomys tridecemlineatus]
MPDSCSWKKQKLKAIYISQCDEHPKAILDQTMLTQHKGHGHIRGATTVKEALGYGDPLRDSGSILELVMAWISLVKTPMRLGQRRPSGHLSKLQSGKWLLHLKSYLAAKASYQGPDQNNFGKGKVHLRAYGFRGLNP